MGDAGKRILFSRKDDWEAGIRAAIRQHVPHFQEFEHADADRFDLIVPLTLKDARHFNRHFVHLNAVKALVPSNAAIDVCDDKQAFASHLNRAGFGNWLPRNMSGPGFPYLLKRRVSQWGEDSFIIRDAADEARHAGYLHSPEFLRQECIEGHAEYTSHILMAGGRIVFMRTLEFGFDSALYVKGKAASPRKQTCVDHARHAVLFQDILNCVGLQGFCCFNYKLRDGVPKIFEVNPRYGASMTCFVEQAIDSLRRALPESRPRWRRCWLPAQSRV